MSCSISVSWCSSTCCLQWFAICLSDVGDYEGIKVKIGNSYIIRDHLEVKCSLGWSISVHHSMNETSLMLISTASNWTQSKRCNVYPYSWILVSCGTNTPIYLHMTVPLETSSNTTIVSFSQVFCVCWITVVPAESCSRYFCVTSDSHLWRGQWNE